ncbi:MAG: GNAT family N-acetyltransferase [Planctomycetota bacterium]|nr:GNAT family N-acetyltransferase [Planctomycetota bacterium]
MFHIHKVDPASLQVQSLIAALDSFQGQFYPAESNHHDPLVELQKDHVHVLGAYQKTKLVACGAVKLFAGDYGELKRMYVSPGCRGRGVGALLVTALESIVKEAQIPRTRLETGIHHEAALRFYRRCGYTVRGPYGDYPRHDKLSVFMEKQLDL